MYLSSAKHGSEKFELSSKKPAQNFSQTLDQTLQAIVGGKLEFKGKKCTDKTYIRAKQHEL